MSGPTDAPEPGDGSPVDRLLSDRQLLVVSNREPYSHEYDGDGIAVSRPAGGLTAVLDPVVQRLGGTWIAWGSGSADDAVVDDEDRVAVPPADPAYELRRVWLDEDLVDGYYYGYSNQVLWPLSHSLPSKVNYSDAFWDAYGRANRRFADAIAAAADDDPIVWLHDYHFGLAPRMVRGELGEDATLAQFWHIPWPPWDVFRRAPHHRELLDSLLCNDLIGFHTNHDRQQFVACAKRVLDASYDASAGAVFREGERTYVRTAPIQIGIDEVAARADADDARSYWKELADAHGLADRTVALGVDRLDYTKGIEERLDALETFFDSYPEWRGELTYVQKASESRSDIDEYRALQWDVERRIAASNDRFGTDDWRPIVYVTEHLSPACTPTPTWRWSAPAATG